MSLRAARVAFLFTAAAAVTAACSSGTPRPPGLQNTGNGSPPAGGGNSGTGTGSGADAAVGGSDAAAGEACTSLTLTAAGPCETVKASAPPTPGGGTLVDGTYGLSTVNVYEGADASAAQTTCDIRYELIVAGGTIQIAYELGQEQLLQAASGTYATSGNVITFDFSCQAFNGAPVTPQTAYAAFTADGADLRLYGAPFSTNPTGLSLSTEYVFGLR